MPAWFGRTIDLPSDRRGPGRRRNTVNQFYRFVAVVVAAAAFVFFLNLGKPGLWDDDEPKNAECAREMLEAGNWFVPVFNGELRTDKPILLYWLMLGAYQLFGVSEFSARIWSALLSIGTTVLTCQIGKTLYRPQVGVWSGLALASSLMFCVAARAATPDATLIFFSTLAFFLFVRGVSAATRGGAGETSTTTGTQTAGQRIRPSAKTFACVYAAVGLAVLAKGPAGFVLPAAVIGLFLHFSWSSQRSASIDADLKVTRWRRTWRWGVAAMNPVRVGRSVWAIRPFLAVAVVGAVALPWYIAVAVKTNGSWVLGFLGTHNVGRFLNAMEGHGGPPFYYLVAILAGMFPWSLFLPRAIFEAFERAKIDPAKHWGDLFLLCWAGSYIVFFSLARTKLPSYVLPCYPALAVLAGRFVDGWLSQPGPVGRHALRATFALGAGAGGLFCVATPIVASFLLPGEWKIGIAGLVPLAGNLLAWRFAAQGRRVLAVKTFAGSAVAFAALLFGVVSLQVDRHQISREFVNVVRQFNSESAQIAAFDYFQPSLVFYARQPVPDLATFEAVGQFLNASPQGYVITRSDDFEALRPVLPADVHVLRRKRMFLRRRHDVLLLGRRTLSGSQTPPQTAKSNDSGPTR